MEVKLEFPDRLEGGVRPKHFHGDMDDFLRGRFRYFLQ